jgi:hypothetical protein
MRHWKVALPALAGCFALLLLAYYTRILVHSQDTASDTSPSGFELSSNAYRKLAQAHFSLGLAPFPDTAAETEKMLESLQLPGATWQRTTSSSNSTVWQLGNAVTLLLGEDDLVQRAIYHLPASRELQAAELGDALGMLWGLAEEQQRPLNLQTSEAYGLHQQPFFLEFSTEHSTLRFTPRFTDGRCTRIEVEQITVGQASSKGK